MPAKVISIFTAFIIICSLLKTTDVTATAIQDQCTTTYNNTINNLNKQVERYKIEGHNIPAEIENALSELSSERLVSTVSLNETSTDNSTGITMFSFEGPYTIYGDYKQNLLYKQACLNEILTKYCPNGFRIQDLEIQCQSLSSGARGLGFRGKDK